MRLAISNITINNITIKMTIISHQLNGVSGCTGSVGIGDVAVGSTVGVGSGVTGVKVGVGGREGGGVTEAVISTVLLIITLSNCAALTLALLIRVTTAG